ncbi:DNRLRE domain-containing protein [Streptomyces sp. SID11233]|nr:DNRLRE domain-containing protein [Streptomyces sp. SID11233]
MEAGREIAGAGPDHGRRRCQAADRPAHRGRGAGGPVSGPGRPGRTGDGVTGALTPVEDGQVNGVAPNTAYNDDRLASPGTTANLRFQLPAAPAGQRFRDARLSFRTSSDPTAGPADGHGLAPVTGAWTESAATCDSRPSPGTVSGATAVSTGYSVELDAPAPGGALGPAYSSVLTGDGADSLRIRSGDVATAAHRPQLVLTFGAE